LLHTPLILLFLTQRILNIILSDLIIADISGFDPNVMYELGIAHSFNKTTIILSQDLELGKKLPFNISHFKNIGL